MEAYGQKYLCGQVTVSHSAVLKAINMSQAKHFRFSNLMRLSFYYSQQHRAKSKHTILKPELCEAQQR